MAFELRSLQREFCDDRTLVRNEVETYFRALRRVNCLCWFARPFQDHIPRLIGCERCENLSILDVGAGDGFLGETLCDWAKGRHWEWSITSLDINFQALRISKSPRRVAGSVLCLPFHDASFDVVIASQMTHHLNEHDALVLHFQEAWRVARTAVLVSDLHRNAALHGLVCVVALLCGLNRRLRHDGALSVRRGFRLAEWRRLAALAGIPKAEVWLYYGTRILMAASKSVSFISHAASK